MFSKEFIFKYNCKSSFCTFIKKCNSSFTSIVQRDYLNLENNYFRTAFGNCMKSEEKIKTASIYSEYNIHLQLMQAQRTVEILNKKIFPAT